MSLSFVVFLKSKLKFQRKKCGFYFLSEITFSDRRTKSAGQSIYCKMSAACYLQAEVSRYQGAVHLIKVLHG